jgi:hypothetical protein
MIGLYNYPAAANVSNFNPASARIAATLRARADATNSSATSISCVFAKRLYITSKNISSELPSFKRVKAQVHARFRDECRYDSIYDS